MTAPRPENGDGKDRQQLFKERQQWVLDNPDIVAQLHAGRVELLIRSVMSNIVPLRTGESFHYWVRFEWGKNGNPHAHGLCYVPRNPYFDRVLKNEDHRQQLLKKGYDVKLTETWEQAETKIANFFNDYVCEMHPAKDKHGHHLFDFVIKNITRGSQEKPQTTNLKELLDRIFTQKEGEQDVQELKDLILALIEDGQRHDGHGCRRPQEGVHACARTGKRSGHTKTEVYCRYLFPRELFPLDEEDMNKLGEIYEDF